MTGHDTGEEDEEGRNEARDEVSSYARRFLSLGLQCLALVIWAALQLILAVVHRYLPNDPIAQATFLVCLVLEAVSTFCWTGMHVFREMRIFYIRMQTDIHLEEQASRLRLEDAERRGLAQPGQTEE